MTPSIWRTMSLIIWIEVERIEADVLNYSGCWGELQTVGVKSRCGFGVDSGRIEQKESKARSLKLVSLMTDLTLKACSHNYKFSVSSINKDTILNAISAISFCVVLQTLIFQAFMTRFHFIAHSNKAAAAKASYVPLTNSLNYIWINNGTLSLDSWLLTCEGAWYWSQWFW